MSQQLPKTLVLDLDETLIFSTLETSSDVDFDLTLAGQQCFVRVRPGVAAFAERMRPLFNCQIWSTGQPIYVEAVCQTLGLDWMVMWGRDRCRRLDEIPDMHHEPFDKPLSYLNVDMASVVIVDNAPGTFNANPQNGIPITTWRGDPEDRQLDLLGDYLSWLATLDDMRRDHWRWATEVLIARNGRFYHD